MTLQELLNSDMDLASLSALARRSWSWWIDELAAMVPPGWRARFSTSPRQWAEQDGDDRWRFWRGGHQATRAAPRRSEPTCLMLPSGAVLARTLELPPMAAADVRRMLALNLDRLSPLKGELVAHDFEILDRGGPARPMAVRLGVVRRREAEGLLEAARASGLRAARMAVLADGRPAFDFLPSIMAEGDRRLSARGLWWAAAAALMLLNLAVLVGRDMAEVTSLRNLVEAQRPGVAAASRLRARVEAEATARFDLVARGRRTDPLAMLDALSRALPAGAWVRHLEWNGRTLRLVGFRPAGMDIAAAVRGTGRFASPRLLASEAGARNVAGEPYDLTADAKGPR
jgi:general secretion pathway protein L